MAETTIRADAPLPGALESTYGLAVAVDLFKEQGPHLEHDGHEPYAGHEYASPGPGRPACVWVGELTGERRHPQARYTRQLRRAHQAAVQGK